jgi:hypothetical protein
LFGTSGLTSTNDLDLLIYNPADNSSSLFRNFYDPRVKIGVANYADLLSLPTGIFWILTDEPNFYLIENGAVLDMTRYDLVKVPGSEVDFFCN